MSLARNLDLTIIAEGVETDDELECLRKLGCNQFQGYYFGRPQSLDALSQSINANRALPNPAKGKI